jgi:hypothetical protein
MPKLPTGDGVLRGRLVHAKRPEAAANLPVILYALGADGNPGLERAQTAAEGRFAFEGISSDPSVVYLLGTRFNEVPFGTRVQFQEGQQVATVDIPLADMTRDASSLEIVETLIKLDWVGGQLLVEESHHVRNTAEDVIFIPEADRADSEPVFEAMLPKGVAKFMDGQTALGGGPLRDGQNLRFYGPVYPGDQDISYRYLLETPPPSDEAEAALLAIEKHFPAGTGAVKIFTTEGGAEVSGPGLRAAGEPHESEGVVYRSQLADAVVPGGQLLLTVAIPKTTDNTDGLSLARADFWVDLDDTAMRVTAEYVVEVASPIRVRAAPGETLIRFELPEGAEVLGLSGAARALGVATAADGSIGIAGPLPPGRSPFGYKYRVAIRDASARLELSFEVPVALLNVLVADVGLHIESNRLHVRRPFRQGTRTYLQRQAYQIRPDERVELTFTQLEHSSLSKTAAAGVVLITLALAAWYLVAPLLWPKLEVEHAPSPATGELADERERIYDAIRDADHDFETGKIEAGDHQRMRAELRAEAVELLREERAAQEAQTLAAQTLAAAPTDPPLKLAVCPSCGGEAEPSWSFCSHCGGALVVAEGSAE